jgi:hypothetical protein
MHRPDPVPLTVALFGAILVIRGLIIESGSPSGKTWRRDTQPVAYWTIMAAATALVVFLLHEAWAR